MIAFLLQIFQKDELEYSRALPSLAVNCFFSCVLGRLIWEDLFLLTIRRENKKKLNGPNLISFPFLLNLFPSNYSVSGNYMLKPLLRITES